MEQETVVCRCEEVTESEIEKAIEEGRRTISGIKKQTRAGMGACQGKTCSRLIAGIMAKNDIETGPEKVLDTIRSPLVPLLIAQLEEEADE